MGIAARAFNMQCSEGCGNTIQLRAKAGGEFDCSMLDGLKAVCSDCYVKQGGTSFKKSVPERKSNEFIEAKNRVIATAVNMHALVGLLGSVMVPETIRKAMDVLSTRIQVDLSHIKDHFEGGEK